MATEILTDDIPMPDDDRARLVALVDVAPPGADIALAVITCIMWETPNPILERGAFELDAMRIVGKRP